MRVHVDIEKFEKWLKDMGAEILPATNIYEALRFQGSEIGVVYKTGKVANPYTAHAIDCFERKKEWNGKPINVGRNGSYRKEKEKLLKRDGCNCFYCGLPLGEDITLEHLIALSSGGKNTLANEVLAHEKCNWKVRNLPINEKINIAITNRVSLLTTQTEDANN